MLPDFLVLVTLLCKGFFAGGSAELGRYLGNEVPVAFGLRLKVLDSEMLDALIFSVCDSLTSE